MSRRPGADGHGMQVGTIANRMLTKIHVYIEASNVRSARMIHSLLVAVAAETGVIAALLCKFVL
jgi:hypothetical protein